jgi:hypothetical protein
LIVLQPDKIEPRGRTQEGKPEKAVEDQHNKGISNEKKKDDQRRPDKQYFESPLRKKFLWIKFVGIHKLITHSG